MASDKKDKKSKRDKDEHKSKKRHRDTEAQAEEEPRHKRSKSEAPLDGSAAETTDVAPDEPTSADATEKSGKARRSEKRKKKRQSLGAEADETNADVAMTDMTATNGAADEAALEVADAEAASEKKMKRKDKKKHQDQDESQEVDGATDAVAESLAAPEANAEETRKQKKEKKEKRRKDKEATSAKPATQDDADADADTMEIDNSSAKHSHQPFGKLPEQPYPFFTQQVSQYLPLYPLGMIDPLDGYADQHLKPLLNHYVPAFEGVLLGYHNVQIGEAPGKGSLTEKSENSDEAVLESIDEYAVSFGWLTAKLDLFKPSRGAWMEGSVNMQTEGHLGVVCWGMFNASIEAGRLPNGWRWVSLLGSSRSKGISEEAKLPTPEPAEDDGQDATAQLHTTGYWVDDDNQRVKGSVRFQIKNFEVGVSGDYGYLSIEGTMLDARAEKQRSTDELEKLRRWKLRNGASRKEQKRLPDFAMTKFGMDEEEELEDESKRAEVWKGSRPASETAE